MWVRRGDFLQGAASRKFSGGCYVVFGLRLRGIVKDTEEDYEGESIKEREAFEMFYDCQILCLFLLFYWKLGGVPSQGKTDPRRYALYRENSGISYAIALPKRIAINIGVIFSVGSATVD